VKREREENRKKGKGCDRIQSLSPKERLKLVMSKRWGNGGTSKTKKEKKMASKTGQNNRKLRNEHPAVKKDQKGK